MSKANKVACLITTDKRGVFSGLISQKDVEETKMRVENARMVVYWDTATKGVLGLAATGPTKGCRVTKAVPSVILHGVTAVVELTEAAVKAFDKEPWG